MWAVEKCPGTLLGIAFYNRTLAKPPPWLWLLLYGHTEMASHGSVSELTQPRSPPGKGNMEVGTL